MALQFAHLSYYPPPPSLTPLCFKILSSAGDLIGDSLSPSWFFAVRKSAYFCRKIYVLLTFSAMVSFNEIRRVEEQFKRLKHGKFPDPLVMNIFQSGEEIIPIKSDSEMNLYIQSKAETFGHK